MTAALVDFYRVAHPQYPDADGRPRGPYRQHGTYELVMLGDRLADAHWDSEHPVPVNDGIGWIEGYEVCGFASIADLETWFDGWLTELADAGFRRYHYRLPAEHVRTGRHQTVAPIPCEPHAVEALT